MALPSANVSITVLPSTIILQKLFKPVIYCHSVPDVGIPINHVLNSVPTYMFKWQAKFCEVKINSAHGLRYEKCLFHRIDKKYCSKNRSFCQYCNNSVVVANKKDCNFRNLKLVPLMAESRQIKGKMWVANLNIRHNRRWIKRSGIEHFTNPRNKALYEVDGQQSI